MNHKYILAIAALISAIGGVLWNKHDSSAASVSQSQQGSNNFQLSGNSNSINITSPQVQEHKVDVCSGRLENSPEFNDRLRKIFESSGQTQYTLKEMEGLNQCISKNKGKIVEVSMWLDATILETALDNLKQNRPLRLLAPSTVVNAGSKTHAVLDIQDGISYEVFPNEGSSDVVIFPIAGKERPNISGYFKVSAVESPYQSSAVKRNISDVTLKGVRIEDIQR